MDKLIARLGNAIVACISGFDRLPRDLDDLDNNKKMGLKELRRLKKARMAFESVEYPAKSKFVIIETECGLMVA